MEYTLEQKDIIATDVKPGELMQIRSFAGSSKTFSLQAYTEARPTKKFLYLAYNVAIAKEAREKFPKNTTVKTTHALAYAKFGKKYRAKLSTIRPYHASEFLKVKFNMGKYFIDVLSNYFQSKDKNIEKKHLVTNGVSEEEFDFNKDGHTVGYLIEQADKLWKAMQDENNKKVPMTHDGYLKLFQLSKPKLKYDYVLIDESQDSNEVTLDIFLSQKCAKIMVADDHQAIYLFRGGVGLPDDLIPDYDKTLTTSFRFGANIANMANLVLHHFKQEKNKLLGFQPSDTIGKIDYEKKYTVIARTNAELFQEAVRAVSGPEPKKIGFIGTSEKNNFSPLEAYYFDKILDIYSLYKGHISLIKDGYVKRFKNYAEFCKTISDERSPDPEFKARNRVVLAYKDLVPKLIDKILAFSVDPAKAEVIFTTAHKSKGLGFNQVKLLDDFVDLVTSESKDKKDKTEEIKSDDEEEDYSDPKWRLIAPEEFDDIQEVNLLYVALTRAKKTLQLNKQLSALTQYLDTHELS